MKRLMIALAGCAGSAPTSTAPAAEPPPPWGVPISGGTLLVTRDGTHAVIADPDRDRILSVVIADTAGTGSLPADASASGIRELALPAGSEPGRLVEDGAGRIHVALRGTGLLVTLSATGVLATQRFACNEPRGVVWEAVTDLVHVACASGELVSLPAAGGDAVRTLALGRDLRDVIVSGSQLVVTRFRTAELITVDAQGTIASIAKPPVVKRAPDLTSSVRIDATPAVAWRTIALPDGTLVMSHQRNSGQVILHPIPGGYGAQLTAQPCMHGPLESGITIVPPSGVPIAAEPFNAGALPVDVATNGSHIAFISAGSHTIVAMATADLLASRDDNTCGFHTDQPHADDRLGAPTAIAFDPSGRLLAFYPELPALVIHDGYDLKGAHTITLPGAFGYDAGRALFHRQAGAGMACASCHPEGRDDGQVWSFDFGNRRTQSLVGGILARGPYHWTGDMADLPTLMQAVFSERMGGGDLTRSEQKSLGPWLDRVAPAQPKATGDDVAIARGQALFLSPDVGCIGCHSGPLYTNNRLVDVGTGGTFKVPSLLGVGARAPFLHNGCAATLLDRFTCGGAVHGNTASLSATQLTDLVAFLDSL